MELFLDPGSWIALITLTFLEIVLGIDNLIFISLVSSNLPDDKRQPVRVTGLTLALLLRIVMLLGITWIIKFDHTLFTLFGEGISGREMILFAGGAFLIAKSTSEIHNKLDQGGHDKAIKKPGTAFSVISQIVLLDLIFSFDSILTAIGMTKVVALMIIAMVIAMIVMLVFARSISGYMEKNPTLQILALSFLILIGFMLMLEAVEIHVPKGYIYFAVFFSLVVEMMNMRLRKKRKPVHLHQRSEDVVKKNGT
ncbi:MAG: TerC family protein [Vicingaceae bacterium]